MTHCSDDDLVLHYYGEPCDVEPHLRACAECATRYQSLSAALAAIPTDVPARAGGYEADVWRRIAPHVRIRRVWLPSPAVRWTLAAAATVALIASGYLAGRLSSGSQPPRSARTAVADVDDQARRRILLLNVAEHLERSDRVLTDVMNAPDVDIAAEQQWATELIATNRLYRQDAVDANESSVATVLDELERALLDIVHRPADAGADLDTIRNRIDAAALLFKVRVMRTELLQGQEGTS
jgi:hypothetical protein